MAEILEPWIHFIHVAINLQFDVQRIIKVIIISKHRHL
jgi:hypothetical protein